MGCQPFVVAAAAGVAVALAADEMAVHGGQPVDWDLRPSIVQHPLSDSTTQQYQRTVEVPSQMRHHCGRLPGECQGVKLPRDPWMGASPHGLLAHHPLLIPRQAALCCPVSNHWSLLLSP